MHQLLAVAHQGVDLHVRIAGNAGGRQVGQRRLPQLGHRGFERRPVERRQQGALELAVEYHAAGRDAVRREGRRAVAQWDHHLTDPGLGGVPEGVHRAGAAERVEREVARVLPALQRLLADHRGRTRVVDPQDACCRLLHGEVEPAGEPPHRGDGRVAVQRHPAVQERLGAEQAEHDVGVGHRRVNAAAAVAGRARLGARAGRADSQPAGRLVDPGDRATAAGDRAHVQVRQPVGVLVDHFLLRHQRLTVDHQPEVERGAAHVGCHHVVVAVGAGEGRDADQPAGRAGVDDAQRGGGGRGQHAAVGLHDQQRGREPALQVAEIPGAGRADVAVEHGGDGALVLAEPG